MTFEQTLPRGRYRIVFLIPFEGFTWIEYEVYADKERLTRFLIPFEGFMSTKRIGGMVDKELVSNPF